MQTGYRHREPTETEKTRRKHRPDKLPRGLAHESDIFVVVISVQEAMNIDKIYISTEVNTCAK